MNPAGFVSGYIARLQGVLSQIDAGEIARLIECLATVRAEGGTIWFVGNGGKAALCDEWVNDLTVALPIQTVRPFRAVSLMSNSAALTAAANDYGYENALWQLLARQIRANDVLVALSGSGESPNILAAIQATDLWECESVGIGRGGRLAKIVDYFVRIPAAEDGPTEDAMMAILHAVHSYFKLADV